MYLVLRNTEIFCERAKCFESVSSAVFRAYAESSVVLVDDDLVVLSLLQPSDVGHEVG